METCCCALRERTALKKLLTSSEVELMETFAIPLPLQVGLRASDFLGS